MTPVIGVVRSVQGVVGRTVKELAALPERPPVTELPQVPAIPQHQDPGVPAVAAAPLHAESGPALTDPSTIVRTNASPLADQAGARAGTRTSGFEAKGVVFAPAALVTTADLSPVPTGPPPDTPATALGSPHDAGSDSGPPGGSSHGEADLPEQRALAPPPRHGPIPDGRQIPSAAPAFDPGSSPD
ncbi:hypothetical protein [Arthrobacter bambusae]|uniref:hypothetical protein n=1 Tax=Arthrobacter bambusae TaxID=1338426 RepID=UPI002787D853|nr:hypothetical protein [Arthrobacter bambusae]MDQ0031766.1 hypothetical protein [Arthrobacter bambusae]MDQ0099956.1 hypothetical protein [Arthrobacter bambusae]